MKNKNKLHSSVTILALTVASIFGELYSVDINAAPTPTPAPYPTYKKKYPAFRKKRVAFSSEEDKRLEDLVEMCGGPSNWGRGFWVKIAELMPGRTPKQCRERWRYYLSPDINKNDWSEEEDELILQKYEEIGPKWVKMKKFFEGRTDTQLKKRYIFLLNSHKASLRQTEPEDQLLCEIEDEAPVQIPQQTSINSPLAFRPPMVAPDIDLYNTDPQTEHEDNLPKKRKKRKNKVSTSNLSPLPIINLQQASIPAPRINTNTPQEHRTLQNSNTVIEINLIPQIMENNEIQTSHLLSTTPDLIPQIENRNQLLQIRITREEQVEPLHIHHPNPIPSIDTIINQLPNRRVEEEEDQTLTFDPISTISRQERPNLLPTFNLLEEPDFYSSNMGSQMRNENQFSERESGAPSFYGLSIPPLQQHRLFDDSSLTNTNDQEEDPIMRSHNNISSRPQRLLDFDDPLAPSNFQPQHRLFDMSLDIDPSLTNAENQDEDSSRRRFPSLFDDDSFSFKPKRFRDFDDFL